MIKAIFFDLDGTLLPMDLDIFLKNYMGSMAKYLAPCGYDPNVFLKGMWASFDAMMKNDGSRTNEEIFFEVFSAVTGKNAREAVPTFERFYSEEFDKISSVCGRTPRAKELIDELKKFPTKIVLATSPVYPAVATHARVRWAGLSPDDFHYVTTYENSTYTKPNPKYYRDLAEKLGLAPEECLMIGNDTRDDLPAREVGMRVFLLTDDLLNRDGIDISSVPQGGYDELIEFLHSALK